MLSKLSGRLLMPAAMVAGVLQPMARSALPCLARGPLRLRNFTSSTVRCKSDKDNFGSQVFSEDSPFQSLEYLLSETPEPTLEAVVAQLHDEQVCHLPLVVDCGKRWQVAADARLTLPRRNRADVDPSSHTWGEYRYMSFQLPSVPLLKNFNLDIAKFLMSGPVEPVLLLDSRSCTLTVGLPVYVGMEAPYPAKQNRAKITHWLKQYRDEKSPAELKQELIHKLRKFVIPNGFKRSHHIFSRFLFKRFDSLIQRSLERTQARKAAQSDSSSIEESVPVDVGSSSTRPVAQEASEAWKAERNDGERRDGTAGTSEADLAGRLSEDDPELPKAGTFVAQDGDAHNAGGEGEQLEEHVPFPTPSAEEMGIKKPTET